MCFFLFLILSVPLLMVNDNCQLCFGDKLQRGEEEIIKISLQEEGSPWLPENDVTPKSHHFPAESKGKLDSIIPKIFIFQRMRLRPRGLVLPKASSRAGTEECLLGHSSALSTTKAHPALAPLSTPVF